MFLKKRFPSARPWSHEGLSVHKPSQAADPQGSPEIGTERHFLSCALASAGMDRASLSHLKPQFPYLFMGVKTLLIFFVLYKD